VPFESGQVRRVGSGVEASVVGFVEVDLLDLLVVLLLVVLLLDVLLLVVLLLVVLLLEDGAVMALLVLVKEVVELVEEDVLDEADVVENSEDVLDVETTLNEDTVKTVLGKDDEEELERELTGCTPFCGLMQAEPAHDGPPTVSVSKTGLGSARSPDSLSAPSGVTSSYAKAYPITC